MGKSSQNVSCIVVPTNIPIPVQAQDLFIIHKRLRSWQMKEISLSRVLAQKLHIILELARRLPGQADSTLVNRLSLQLNKLVAPKSRPKTLRKKFSAFGHWAKIKRVIVHQDIRWSHYSFQFIIWPFGGMRISRPLVQIRQGSGVGKTRMLVILKPFRRHITYVILENYRPLLKN